MLIIFLGVAFTIGFALLLSAVCERELLRAEQEEKPHKVTPFLQQDGGEPASRPYREVKGEWPNCDSRSTPKQNRDFVPDTSENDEVAA